MLPTAWSVTEGELGAECWGEFGAGGGKRYGVWCSAYVLRLSTRWVEHVASVAWMKNRHKICPEY
jgi:hypothetical protein